MKRRFVLAAALGVWGSGALLGPVFSAGRGERQQEAAALVEQALESELSAANEQRETLLQEALETSPDYAPARWQAGYVHAGKKWLKLADLASELSRDSHLTAYRLARKKHDDSAASQLDLARWCAGKKLLDQERAHLNRVVELAPNHAEARRLLGQRLVGGQWRTEAELAQANRNAARQTAELAGWRPKIEALRDKLLHDNRRLREAALEQFDRIADPAAAGAIELLMSSHSEPLALLALDAFGRMPTQAATLAIVRQALASPWPAVRTAAAAKLRSRDKFHYVPTLLAGMSAPLQTRSLLLAAPNGEVYYRHIFFQEGKEQNALAATDTDYRPMVLSARSAREAYWARQILLAERVNQAATTARSRDLAVAQQNAAIGAANARISGVLAEATGEKNRATAEDWWSWWDDYNESYPAGPKPVYTSYKFSDGQRFYDPSPYLPPAMRHCACFVAGTEVWTELGPKAIEQIQVGDRVFAQDVQTGELALKPVLQTTVRERAPTFAVSVAEQTLRCTGGHLFWVAGRGWVKARYLEPGQALHGVEGAATVGRVKASGEATTYNLVVADFNDYFVGPEKLLTHDVTTRQSTSTVLPGLMSE